MTSQNDLTEQDRLGIVHATEVIQEWLTSGEIKVVKDALVKMLKKHNIDINSPYGQAWMQVIRELEQGFEDAYDRAMRGL